MKKTALALGILLIFVIIAAGCNLNKQEDRSIQPGRGLSISAEFEATDINFSEPIRFTVTAQNQHDSTIAETITIILLGMPLENPLVATMATHVTVAEFTRTLQVLPGETASHKFIVEMDTYEDVGTGNYTLFFLEAEESLDHAYLSGALEIELIAPKTIHRDQSLPYQVNVHNPTNSLIHHISIRELHQHFEAFIPSLLPGETVTFRHSISPTHYQNSFQTGVTVLTETPRHGTDLASIIIGVNEDP